MTRTRAWIAAFLIYILHSVSVQAASVNLAWNANSEIDIVGYRLYYGTASQTYSHQIDVGNLTTTTVPNLTAGIVYFFSATAYNTYGVESPFSSELAYSVPGASPTPTPIGATPTPTPTSAPSATPGQSGGPTVTSLALANNDNSGQNLMALANGSVVNLASLPTQNINVQALVSSSNGISQVVFVLDSFSHTEATAPYALCGDWDPCPANTLTSLGSHTLSVTGYDSAGATGTTLVVTFIVTDQPMATPSPTPVPTATPVLPPTPSPTPTHTPAPAPSETPPPAPTATPAVSPTPSPTPINTPTPTPPPPSATPTPSPSSSPTLSATPAPTPSPATTPSPSPTEAPSPAPSEQTTLANVSTRLFVQSDNNVMIGGFIVYGENPKKLILRAIGPSLSTLGLPDAMPDPALRLFDSSSSIIASNDNWRSDQSQIIQETGLAPSDDHEAALVATLSPGSYTAVLNDASNSPGSALFEFYDLDFPNSQLINLSTRGTVQTQDRVMIGGFIINGEQPASFILRAIGPSLSLAGIPDALLDPTLELFDSEGTLILQNDNWRSSQEQQILDSSLAPTDDRESAIFATLPPGPYSAIVRGTANSTGIALFEIYKLLP